MNKEDFLKELADIMRTEMSITVETKLSEIPEWDSLAMMACVTLLSENFGIHKTISDFQKLQKVEDILNLVKDQLE